MVIPYVMITSLSTTHFLRWKGETRQAAVITLIYIYLKFQIDLRCLLCKSIDKVKKSFVLNFKSPLKRSILKIETWNFECTCQTLFPTGIIYMPGPYLDVVFLLHGPPSWDLTFIKILHDQRIFNLKTV